MPSIRCRCGRITDFGLNCVKCSMVYDSKNSEKYEEEGEEITELSWEDLEFEDDEED